MTNSLPPNHFENRENDLPRPTVGVSTAAPGLVSFQNGILVAFDLDLTTSIRVPELSPQPHVPSTELRLVLSRGLAKRFLQALIQTVESLDHNTDTDQS